MRILFVATLLSLVATTSFARERAYRVVGNTAIESGFALAWGMKGQNLDFEALDRLPDPSQFFYDNQEKLVNYLVDLENETILETVLEPALVGRAGDSHVLHNHDTIGLISLPIEGLEYEESGMAVVAQFKWFNELTKLVIVKRTATDSVIELESKRIGNDIENAILAKLNAAQRKKYVDYQGAVTWSFRSITESDFTRKILVEAEAIHPKLEDPTLTLSAKIQLVKKDASIQVVVDSASLKENK